MLSANGVMVRYAVLLILVVVIAGAALVALLPDEPRADFRFVNRGTIFTLDPAAMSWLQDIRIALSVWEGLYSYDPQTGLPIPAVSLPAEISPDGLTYTFRLRPEARWHTGEPVVADDFIYGWRRAVEPGTARDYAFFFNHIAGVRDYVDWRTAETQRIGAIADPAARRAERDAHLAEADRWFAAKVGIQAPDPHILIVTLNRPLPYFLDLCAFSTFLPAHRASVERFKLVGEQGLIYYDEQWVKPGNAVYNGAFYASEWKFKRHLRMLRNPYYWRADTVKLNSIEMIEVEDPNTAWLLYSSGQADWVSDMGMTYTPELIASSGSPVSNALNTTGLLRRDVHTFSSFGTYFYNFNCKDKLPDGRDNPFRDPRVRQAFTLAVDKRQLVDEVIRYGNPVATSFIPHGSLPGYPRVDGLPHDPQRARQLLAEAGYPGGKSFPEVVVLLNTGSQHELIAQAVINMWQRQLGVRGRIEGKEGKTYREDKSNVNFIICRASWYGDYGDPTTFLDMFDSNNGNNDSGYKDPAYDAMLQAADLEPDPQRRLERLAEVERFLVNEALPLLPLYEFVNCFAFDPDRVRNLYLTPRLSTVLRVVEVAR